MSEFKKGDKVICIRVFISKVKGKVKNYTHITKGKEYEVLSDRNDNDICIINDKGDRYYYSAKRFKPLTEYRNIVIDDIIS